MEEREKENSNLECDLPLFPFYFDLMDVYVLVLLRWATLLAGGRRRIGRDDLLISSRHLSRIFGAPLLINQADHAAA